MDKKKYEEKQFTIILSLHEVDDVESALEYWIKNCQNIDHFRSDEEEDVDAMAKRLEEGVLVQLRKISGVEPLGKDHGKEK